MDKYYVYMHCYAATGVPFYVGKGTGNRAYRKHGRSSAWKKITDLNSYEVEIVKKNLTNNEALSLEKEIILNNSNLINSRVNNSINKLPGTLFEMFKYCEQSPSCLVYAKDVYGINGRKYHSKGDIAGNKLCTSNKKSHKWSVQVSYREYLVHRIIYGMFNNLDENLLVDHINGDSTDNRISNLRSVDYSLNARNSKFFSNSTGVRGVTIANRKRLNCVQYVARYQSLDGKQISKEFSSYKYGLLPAFTMACVWRENALKELNKLGAGYTDRHMNGLEQ